MRYISWDEQAEYSHYLHLAAEIAKNSTCDRAHCGSLIVSDSIIIGEGFNGPPGEHHGQKRCTVSKSSYHTKVTDKTCCVHAEQRAILHALQHHPDKIVWSKLYFIRLNENSEISYAGKPYCTICSKIALDAGIHEFVLWHTEGIAAYTTDEYNTLSFAYEE